MKRRSDGRWQKKITLPNGKTKTLYSSANSERLASRDFNDQLMALKIYEKNKSRFKSVAEEWKAHHFPLLQNNSLKSYRPAYKSAVDFFGEYFMTDIKPINIQNYLDSLISKKYAEKTIKNRMLVLNLILSYAKIQIECIDYKPNQDISVPKNLPKTQRLNASKRDEKIICQNTDSMIGVLAYLYLSTGCRRGEAVALTPNDVDLVEKTININKTVEWVGNKPQMKNFPKTESGNRKIPITDKLANLLKPYMNQEYIFANDNGDLIDNSQFTRMWNKYKAECGINCTPHELRHSYATILFDAGIDIKTAQFWLGHKDIQTTLKIYTHLSEQKRIESTHKLINYLTTF